jgi:spore photoproduct lyase
MSSNANSGKRDGGRTRRPLSAETQSTADSPNAEAPIGRGGLFFSHIYIEERAVAYEDTARILDLFPQAVRIPIVDYQEVFARPNQSFQLQKNDNKLILAVKKDHFLYRGSERINSFGDRHLYYNSLIRNCLYNCDYCFLQGMHPSAYIVAYVNNTDFFAAVESHLSREPLYLSISYLTDLLGFEGLLPHARRWIEFARDRPALTIEIRTKSDNYRSIRDLEPIPNAILSWTMSPETIAACFERGTASFKNRLLSARSAVEDGWRVRLCFDPLLRVAGWRKEYRDCIEELFRRIPPDGIEEFSVGVLRMSSSHLKAMKTSGSRSVLIRRHLQVSNRTATYPPETEAEMRDFVRDEIAHFADPARISYVGG